MANPFAPAQVDIAGGINDLLSQYQTMQKLRKQQELEVARKTALQGLMQGGDPRESIQKLMGIGDIQGAQALATAFKTMQPPGVTPGELLAHQDRAAALQEASSARRWSAVPQSTKEYWNAYPSAAPPEYRQYIGIGGGGDQGMPQPTAQPEQQSVPQTTPASTETPQPQAWQPNAEQYKLIQSGKMMRPEAAAKHVELVNSSLEQTKQAAQALLDNPDLDKAVGGAATMLQRPPGNTFWDRATAMWPGTGAYLSSTDEHGKIVPSQIMGGTSVADAQAAINSLKDQISLAIISKMKEASNGTTGLGRVMQIEYAGWQNALGSLDPHQRPETFRKNLQNIINDVSKSQATINEGFSKDYGGSQAQQPPPTSTSGWTQPVQVPQEYQNLAPIPGATRITTDPNGAYLPDRTSAAPASPQGMNDQQTIGLARQLRQQGLSKEQIIAWFKARGVTIEP